MGQQDFAGLPLAIIGMACRLPGADDLEQFWHLIRTGRSGLGELPADRLDQQCYYAPHIGTLGKSYTKLGGVVPEQPCNAAIGPASEDLGTAYDPVHLTLLQVAATACRHAGLEPLALPHRNTGVYIGNARGSLLGSDLVYGTHIAEIAHRLGTLDALQQIDADTRAALIDTIITQVRARQPCRTHDYNPNVTPSGAASIITRAFGLTGPYVAVDAACASSLYALLLAARALQSGQIDMAIVGGASYSSWQSLVLFSQAQALSATGSFPFDRRADGFISADGYVAIVVKTLAQAVADGNDIHAVIRGLGVSSDGRGRSLWAPRAEGQMAALQRAYVHGAAPSRVQYVEAHGTSTQLGDATEVQALSNFFGEYLSTGTRVPVASVKANIGHTRETAGLAGLLKVVLAMQHGLIPAATNFATPNAQIDWARLPFFVPTEDMVWPSQPDGHPRCAAVDSFGIGGLNAHVVLEAYEDTHHGVSVTASVATPQATDREAIAIIGMGAVFPGVRTVQALHELLISGQDPKVTITDERWPADLYVDEHDNSPWRVPTRTVGLITDFVYDWHKHKIPPRQLQNADPLQFMILDAADQCLDDAGYTDKPFDRQRTAVVVGTIFGGDFANHLSLALRLPEIEQDIAVALRDHGMSAEQCQQVLTAFAQFFRQWKSMLHDETGSYSSSTLASRVSKSLDLMGGACAVDAGESSALTALSAAVDLLRAGDCDMVFCAGAQRMLDVAFHEIYARRGLLAAPHHPNGVVLGEGAGLVLLKRLQDAQRDGDPIRAVIHQVETITHGELDAGVRQQAFKPDPIIDQIGHTLGASGMATLLKAILTPERTHSGGERTEVKTFAHDGLACRAWLDVGNVALAAPPVEWRIVRIGASTLSEIASRVCRSVSDAQALYEMAAASRFSPADRCRLALVTDTPARLATQLKLANQQLAHAEARQALMEQGICYHECHQEPRVAMLFPGQGSQYHGMFRPLVESMPEAAAWLDEIDQTMTRLGHETFSDLAWDPDSAMGRDIWQTQVSVLLADMLMYRLVTAMGLRPDVISAHSYGEYAAMVAGGVWSLERAIQITYARCQYISASEQANGVLLSVAAAPEVVEGVAAGIPGTVCVANHNAPEQTVAGGDPEAVAELEVRLSRAGVTCRLLAVPAPFHTPLMAEVQQPLNDILQNEPLQPPRIPLLSSVSNRYVADPIDLRNNLVTQLTQPVRYVDLVRRLVADGVNVVVEVGPRQVLTRLHRHIVDDPQVLLVSCDNPKRPGLEALVRLQAALECAGALRLQEHPQTLQLTNADATPISSPAPKPQLLHYDATQRRRENMRRRAESTTVPAAPTGPEPPAPPDADHELAQFLLNFVCEQTGYPLEVVGLDADLEADLGIDSIKKAQLLGELSEQFAFRLDSTSNLTLDDVSTLRHVLTLLQGVTPQAEPATTAAEAARASSPAPTHSTTVPSPQTSNGAAPPEPLTLVRCSGTPYEMGRCYATQQRAEITRLLDQAHDLFETILDTYGNNRDDVKQLLAQSKSHFTPDGWDEILGMAAVLEQPPHYLVAFNLLGLYPEYAGGCAQFAVWTQQHGHRALLHGVNEDWPLSLLLPNILHHIVQVRHPVEGIPHLLCSVSGQVGGLNGMNAHGIAVTSTMLLDRPHDRRLTTPGVLHPIIVKTVLAQAHDIASAVDIVRDLQRIGAWSLCISQPTSGQVCYLEYDGPALEVQHNPVRVATTNHSMLYPKTHEPPSHSRYRMERLVHLLDTTADADLTVAQARTMLRDRYDIGRERDTVHPTMNTLWRRDNRMSLVMRPTTNELWVTAGPAAAGSDAPFYYLDAAELMGSAASAARAPERTVMQRYVLRMVEAPLPATVPTSFQAHGQVLILGENPTAAALREQLAALGASVCSLPLGDSDDHTLAALERYCQPHVAPHLFLLTAREPEPGQFGWSSWAHRRALGVTLPYRVCQRWVELVEQAGLLGQATLVAATAMGGNLGLTGEVCTVDSGGLAGLLKAIRREVSGLKVKIIDTPIEESPVSVAATILSELGSDAPEMEVGYRRGCRRLLKAVPKPLMSFVSPAIPYGSTWVCTGGARGITAVVARELGRRFGLKLHLLGTRALSDVDASWFSLSAAERKQRRLDLMQAVRQAGDDPRGSWQAIEKAIEIHNTLQTLAQEGIQATYHVCDVANLEALARVLADIRRVDGPIMGIVHGAGFEAAASLQRKALPSVEATIAAKVDGAVALMECCRQDPLQYFIAFGSVSGRFGGFGQTDYAQASDMLCKLIQRFRRERPECRSVAIHWPAWDEVGMAMRPESKIALAAAQQTFMPPREGVRHLLHELGSNAPEGEVLIVDGPGLLDRDATLPTPAEAEAYAQRLAAITHAALIDGVYGLEADQGLMADVCFSSTTDPFLHEHQFQGVPLLPAVIGLEALAEAAAILRPGQTVVGLRQVDIVSGLRFDTHSTRQARVQAHVQKDGVSCRLRSDFYNRQGRLVDPDRPYVTGVVELADKPLGLSSESLAMPPNAWQDVQYRDPQQAHAERLMYHGPHFRCVQQMQLHAEGGWARLITPALTHIGGARPAGWIIPAVPLDGCLVACGIFAKVRLQCRQLPRGFERVQLYRLPATGEVCILQIIYGGRVHDDIVFDFTLWGEDKTVILAVTGYRGVVLSGNAA